MTTEPRFLLADAELSREKAERLFERVREEIAPSLPPESDFRHIGATAIPNCLTKGDLDVAIRVRSEVFQTVDAFLAKRFARNAGSLRTDQFSAFEDSSSDPHLGIQLTVIGGPQDVFHLFAEALCQSPSLVSKYNLLKRRYNGADMASYRKAKDAFIEHVLAAASR